jgi:hypothetical protein
MTKLHEYIQDHLHSINWDEYSLSCQIVNDFDLIEEFRPYWNWQMLSKNRTIGWNHKLIDKYSLLWDWNELSLNPTIKLTNGLILHFQEFWNWENLLQNHQTPFTHSLYECLYLKWNITDDKAKEKSKQFETDFQSGRILRYQIPTDPNNVVAYTNFSIKFLKIYHHNTRFSFGKYKGQTIYEIMCSEDFNYLVWSLCNIEHIIFDSLVFYDLMLCAVIRKGLLNELKRLNNKKLKQFENKSKISWNNFDPKYEFNDTCPYCLESPCRCSDPF